jgi:hypothetical protein
MRLLTVLAAPFVLALPLAAQHPAHRDSARAGTMQHGQMHDMHHEMMEAMMAPMMQAMAFTPAQLLERKDSLQLTAQQVTQLTQLRDESKRAHDAAADEAKKHRDALLQALQGTDSAAVRSHFQGMHQAMGDAHWSMLRAVSRARGVLTEAQRARVAESAKHREGSAKHEHRD